MKGEDVMGHKIITIGRQFGSGGREVGSRLAKSLGLPLYDKNLVEMAAKKLDISEETAGCPNLLAFRCMTGI